MSGHPLLELGGPLVVGHRGNSAHAPENTLEAFRQAVALGVDGLEFDVRLSADGEPVVIHDPWLDRTTNETGPVAARTVAQLGALDAGHRFSTDGGRTFPYRERGIGVPALRHVLEAFPDTPVLIELKTVEVAPAVRRVVEHMGAEGRVVVASFADAAKRVFEGSRIAVGAATGDVARLLVPALLRRPGRALPFRFMTIPPSHRGLPLPVRALTEMLEHARLPLHVWTIDDARLAHAFWRVGVRAILSNDPGTILRARAASDVR